jgi:hypothetical protein
MTALDPRKLQEGRTGASIISNPSLRTYSTYELQYRKSAIGSEPGLFILSLNGSCLTNTFHRAARDAHKRTSECHSS